MLLVTPPILTALLAEMEKELQQMLK